MKKQCPTCKKDSPSHFFYKGECIHCAAGGDKKNKEARNNIKNGCK